MRGYSSRHGKREAPGRRNPLAEAWGQYRWWVAGLDRRGRIRYRLCLGLAIFAILALIVALWLKAWIRLPDVPDQPVLPGAADPASSDFLPDVSYQDQDLPDVMLSGRKDGYYTFLLCGQDVVSGATDTMILISYDTEGQKINAISLLRDTMINTSAKRGAEKRLNTVYARNRGDKSLSKQERVKNGMAALRQEVSKITGIYPDYFVLVQWEAIGKLVDAIGGVEFEVPFDMDYDDPTPGQDLHIHQKKGLRKLNGQDAMQVIRFRKNNDKTHQLGDSGRTQIQRDFLTATIKKCLTPEIVLKLPSLAQIFIDNVDTDLSVGNILAFAQLAIGMEVDESVKFVSMPFTNVMYDEAALALVKEEEILELLNDGINPYQDEIGADDLQLMYRTSSGGYGVTNAALADSAMGGGTSSGSRPSTGNSTSSGNEPSSGSKPSSGNGTSSGSKPSSGNKPSSGDEPSEDDPPDEKDPDDPPDENDPGEEDPDEGNDPSTDDPSGESPNEGNGPGEDDPEGNEPGLGAAGPVTIQPSGDQPLTTVPTGEPPEIGSPQWE